MDHIDFIAFMEKVIVILYLASVRTAIFDYKFIFQITFRFFICTRNATTNYGRSDYGTMRD